MLVAVLLLLLLANRVCVLEGANSKQLGVKSKASRSGRIPNTTLALQQEGAAAYLLLDGKGLRGFFQDEGEVPVLRGALR